MSSDTARSALSIAVTALRHIAPELKCEAFTSGIGSCFRVGRTPDARYGADKCCDSCIANDAFERIDKLFGQATQLAAGLRSHLSALSVAPDGSLAAQGQLVVLDTISRAQYKRAKEALDLLTDEQRADLFAEYCKFCGSKNPSCPCMKDE